MNRGARDCAMTGKIVSLWLRNISEPYFFAKKCHLILQAASRGL
jgi:hypothetical protein